MLVVGGGLDLADDPITERLADGFVFGVDVQFFVDAADIVPYGVNADVHLTGSILIAVAF